MTLRRKPVSITGVANTEVLATAITSTTEEKIRVVGVTMNPTSNEDDYLIVKDNRDEIIKEYHANIDNNSHFVAVDREVETGHKVDIGNLSGATGRDAVVTLVYEIIGER